MGIAASIFEVDRKGLAKLLARRGKEFIITELLQNAWDEKGVTHVTVEFSQANGEAHLVVEDDAPDGFTDLTHAYTLFAESKKKANPEQRGRFNIGEKMVIALCRDASIHSTTGTVIFNKLGRSTSKQGRTIAGTRFEAFIPMNQDEAQALRLLAMNLIPPAGIMTTFNGEVLWVRVPKHTFTMTLPTEIADAEGYLRPTARQTVVKVYEPLVGRGEKAMLYEMGIPVVEFGDGIPYHVDVMQKVPLNSDRDNVTPSYMQKVRVAILNEMAEEMVGTETTAPWVGHALEDKSVSLDAVKAVILQRFGDKVVISDPSDPEGTKLATAAGFTVLAPRTFSAEAWRNVRLAGVLPAGQVTPSPKPYAEQGRSERIVPSSSWTPEMVDTVNFLNALSYRLLGRVVLVKIVNEPTVYWQANCGPGEPLTLNLGKLGHRWFARAGSADQIELALHELAHDAVDDHLSTRFGDEVARLGAKLALWLGGHGAGPKENLRSGDL